MKNVENTNQKCCDPFFIYILSWLTSLFLYGLGWSYLFPNLDEKLFLFVLFTCAVCIYFSNKYKRYFFYQKLFKPQQYLGKLRLYMFIILLLLFIECLFFGSCPLFQYVLGHADVGAYTEFGIPYIHAIIVNSLILLFLFSVYCQLSEKHFSISFFIISALSFVSPLLFMNRAVLLQMCVGAFVMYLMSRKHVVKPVVFVALMGLGVLFFFGKMGNLRMNDPDGDYIVRLGGASDEFEKSIVPNEFYWGYIYVTSPIATLQNSINEHKKFEDKTSGGVNFFVNEILPFFRNKFAIPIPDAKQYQLNDSFNVGTTYWFSYLIWGWKGMFSMFFMLCFYCVFMISKVPTNSICHIPLLSVLVIMMVFSMFSNMIHHMGFFPLLIMLLLFKKKLNLNSSGLK